MPTEIVPDAQQLRDLLKTFKDLPPKVRTESRRALRTTGDGVIAGQRAILSGPLPAGVQVTGQALSLGLNRKTGQTFVRKANIFGDRDVSNGGRSSGLRERIKAALATRVVTGTTRQGIEIRTQNGKAPLSTGWNSKRFRHPTFDKEPWVYQAGQPYFYGPVVQGRNDMIAQAIDILNNAMEGT